MKKTDGHANKDQTVMGLITKTMPFFIARLMVYAIFCAAALVLIAVFALIGWVVVKMFAKSSGAFIVVMLIGFGFIWGSLRLVERYALGLLKVGHVAVIAELLEHGNLPEGKGQVAFGKEQVTENFGTANLAFGVDALVAAAVKQIQRWLIRVGGMFSFIPGSDRAVALLGAIMSVALNYIDEAVLAYVFVQKKRQPEVSPWQFARDGVVLYAQSWRGILRTAAMAIGFLWLFYLAIFLPLILAGMAISKFTLKGVENGEWVGGIVAALLAYVITTVLKRAFVDPVLTVAMVREFFRSTRDVAPSQELQGKLTDVSSKFRDLVKKAERGGAPVSA